LVENYFAHKPNVSSFRTGCLNTINMSMPKSHESVALCQLLNLYVSGTHDMYGVIKGILQ